MSLYIPICFLQEQAEAEMKRLRSLGEETIEDFEDDKEYRVVTPACLVLHMLFETMSPQFLIMSYTK